MKARNLEPTPRQQGAAAGWNPRNTETANPYADGTARDEWLEGWRETKRAQASMDEQRRRREAGEA